MRTTFEAAFSFVDFAKAYIDRVTEAKELPKVLHDLRQEQIAFLELYYGKKLYFQTRETDEFIYALKKVAKRITTKTIPEFQNIITDNQIDLCEADEKMEPKRDERGNLVFTKEGMKRRNAFQLSASFLECTVDEFHVSAIPGNLTKEEKEAFAGFVFPANKKADKKQLVNN